MRKITKIIFHCAYTPKGKEFTAKDINNWHNERGWNGIGYHYVVLLDGSIQVGRNEETTGAHTFGHNSDSIGVCYIGGMIKIGEPADTRTDAQKESLEKLAYYLLAKYPKARAFAHTDFSDKTCPVYDAAKEYQKAEEYADNFGGKETAKMIFENDIKPLIKDW